MTWTDAHRAQYPSIRDNRNAAYAAAAEKRNNARAALHAAAVALYDQMATRDIARELDTSVAVVQLAIAKAGLPSRPVSQTPGCPYANNQGWKATRMGATFRKLTPEQVVELREGYAAGIPTKVMGERYGVAVRTVCTIAFGGTYKWVPGALPPEMKRAGRRG
jgi:hypothetical protein